MSTTPTTAGLCAICQSPILEGEANTNCPGCQAGYHADCWNENQGCAVYGCANVPATEGRRSIEVPVGYWGQEYKPCPVCNRQILAAAVRCRNCGTTFQTARPLDSTEFSRSASLQAQAPRLRKTIIWMFVFCLIPFTAPFGAVTAWIWSHSRREEIESLPSLYGALNKIGPIIGAVETGVIAIIGTLFALMRTTS